MLMCSRFVHACSAYIHRDAKAATSECITWLCAASTRSLAHDQRPCGWLRNPFRTTQIRNPTECLVPLRKFRFAAREAGSATIHSMAACLGLSDQGACDSSRRWTKATPCRRCQRLDLPQFDILVNTWVQRAGRHLPKTTIATTSKLRSSGLTLSTSRHFVLRLSLGFSKHSHRSRAGYKKATLEASQRDTRGWGTNSPYFAPTNRHVFRFSGREAVFQRQPSVTYCPLFLWRAMSHPNLVVLAS